MDKNVGSVNLDELKAAREALNRDMGIENDPNMYNDYDPEKHKAEREQERLARAQALEEMTGGVSSDENNVSSEIQPEPSVYEAVETEDSSSSEEILNDSIQDSQINVEPVRELEEKSEQTSSLLTAFDVDDNEIDEIIETSNEPEVIEIHEVESSSDDNQSESDAEKASFDNDYARSPEMEANEKEDEMPNFDVYDNFADFEVNSESASSSVVESEIKSEPVLENAASVEIEKTEESLNEEDDDDGEEESLDDFLKELDSILQKEEDDDEIVSDDENVSLDVELESINSDEPTETEIIEEPKVEEVVEEPEPVKTLKVEDVIKTRAVENIDVPIFDDDDPFSRLERFEVADSQSKIEKEEKNIEGEILDNFKALSEINQELENKTTETESSLEDEEIEEIADEPEEETEEIEVGGYAPIENFNFVDIMSSEEFKKTDKMSYVLGKDSEGEVVYGNLRDTCGTAVFTRDEDVVYDGFSSILLSLLLKNTPDEIQFVVCDAMFDSEFDVFNNSSYMYFNRVAKNNREIVDSLLELSKELEKRYNNLVYAGVKSISAYNFQAEERGAQKMPYVVLFLNNYAKMTQFLDADRINTCLHNILKFGRIVGVYAMVASTSEIERNDINYNLPTRICYKTEDEHDSISALGREGAEGLKDERDFLYSTVYDEELRHLKVPSLTRKEIELIIENLEK